MELRAEDLVFSIGLGVAMVELMALGLGIQGLGLWDSGVGFRALGLGCWV